MQQVVSLQEAVERTEDGSGEHDVQRDALASGQEGVDNTPAQRSHKRTTNRMRQRRHNPQIKNTSQIGREQHNTVEDTT